MIKANIFRLKEVTYCLRCKIVELYVLSKIVTKWVDLLIGNKIENSWFFTIILTKIKCLKCSENFECANDQLIENNWKIAYLSVSTNSIHAIKIFILIFCTITL